MDTLVRLAPLPVGAPSPNRSVTPGMRPVTEALPPLVPSHDLPVG